jgi:histidinol-phosphate aminotransferase
MAVSSASFRADRDALPESQRQGGDLRGLTGGSYLDTGTCVNRYGPPPAVTAAIRAVRGDELLAHPYTADPMFTEHYAAYLGASQAELVAGRGITEFIRTLAYVLPVGDVAVLTPDYTDTIRWFPHHHGPTGLAVEMAPQRLDRLARALSMHPYVMLSNPNNPTGSYLHRDELVRLCCEYPQTTLIVDEAYIDFLDDARELSMIGTGLDNVVVLRSPNKPFGIAGVRTGALWTRNDSLRNSVAARKINWALSHLDVVAATAALSSTDWLKGSLALLASDTARLHGSLTARFGEAAVAESVTHYRFVALDDPEPVHRFLMARGIVTRVFLAGEPGRVPGLRITTPRRDEMPRLLRVISEIPR